MLDDKEIEMLAIECKDLLKLNKKRIAFIESTTGGLISSYLLSIPGASSVFIQGITVYSGRGYKNLLEPEMIKASGIYERENNYKNRENYIESKIKFAKVTSTQMPKKYKSDYVLTENGTTGPEFFIPGVTNGFTAIGINGKVTVIQAPRENSRKENMVYFTKQAFRILRDDLLLLKSKL